MQAAFTVLQDVWGFFNVPMPCVGFTFGDFLLGYFVVSVSLHILKPLLGIGASASDAIGRIGRNSRIRSNRSNVRKSE